jgi:hypothetical protein
MTLRGRSERPEGTDELLGFLPYIRKRLERLAPSAAIERLFSDSFFMRDHFVEVRPGFARSFHGPDKTIETP